MPDKISAALRQTGMSAPLPCLPILYSAEEDLARKVLVREITTFRRHGRAYRRSHETHLVRLLDANRIADLLRSAGFCVHLRRSYGAHFLPPGLVAVFGCK
jgi:hypothetical protein